jgi:hypothetical protein
MKVRILSGNNAGTVEDLDTPAAEWAITSGFAEKVEEAPAVEPVAAPVVTKPDPPLAARRFAEGRRA